MVRNRCQGTGANLVAIYRAGKFPALSEWHAAVPEGGVFNMVRGRAQMESGMSGKWKDVFVIAGPTASGKSALAVELAERSNAEIVSADAYQIYRGLPVLTAQPSPDQLTRVPHHLVNQMEPECDFSAADFARMAGAAMEEIRRRGKRIVVVGGSGFYLEALFDGLPRTPPADADLRERLRLLPTEELAAELRQLDPAAAANVDLKNPRRIQRAIEIVTLTGRPFAEFAVRPDASVRGLVLGVSRDVLQQRIEARTDAMLANGAVEEVRALGPCSATCAKALGVSVISEFLAGKISRAQCREQIFIATRQYAKRQRTWFRNRARWEWVAPESALHFAETRLKI